MYPNSPDRCRSIFRTLVQSVERPYHPPDARTCCPRARAVFSVVCDRLKLARDVLPRRLQRSSSTAFRPPPCDGERPTKEAEMRSTRAVAVAVGLALLLALPAPGQ